MVHKLVSKLSKITISNFKSLKHVDLSLENFNVIVGRNASGKTNFVDFIKFLKQVLVGGKRSYMSFIDWWSYENIVWKGKTDQPIETKLFFDIDGTKVEYELVITGAGGIINIISERLNIENYIVLERKGKIVTINYNKEFIQKNTKDIKDLTKHFRGFTKKKSDSRKIKYNLKDVIHQEFLLESESEFQNFLRIFHPTIFSFPVGNVSFIISASLSSDEGYPMLISENSKKEDTPPFIKVVISEIWNTIDKCIILKHPNMKLAKSPNTPRKEDNLSEDGSNLHNCLYNWWIEKGRLPERIEATLSELFPNTQIRFKLTQEGKVYVKIFEADFEFAPPCTSDGLYKILTILTAIEFKPPLLIIDELENSLYSEALEYAIDELKNSDTQVILTTHSPIVVDMVDLRDLLIAERIHEETQFRRIKNIEKMREKLVELKITPSDSWLHGAFTN